MKQVDRDGDDLVIAGRRFSSRLFVGTGKFASLEAMREAIEESETELVTVAVRRVDLDDDIDRSLKENLLEAIDTNRVMLMPNTSGAITAEEAIRLARLAREMGLGNWIKLEIHPNHRHLMADPIETLKAAEKLVRAGFVVLPYIQPDPVLAKRLEEVGCHAVMPLGSAIGSGRGLRLKETIQMIIEEATVPVVIDAGIGVPSHAAMAMEMGADAVLINTALAVANETGKVARAFRLAVMAGRLAYLDQQKRKRPWMASMPRGTYAQASSPLHGFRNPV